MDYRWSADKDAWLQAERGIGFEEWVTAFPSRKAAKALGYGG